MSAKHTPGPWHIGADGRIVYDVDGWAVSNAVTFHGRHSERDAFSNARLIAEAPAMLEALKNLLEDALALGIADSDISGSALEARAIIARIEA